MQKCTICEKAIYGHPTATKGDLVCGSCTLTKSKGSSSGKSMFQVRLGLSKMYTEEVPKHKVTTMGELTIKSNFARDKVVMLDGLHPLKFDHKGEASCPAHMREAVERLMAAKPGRFWLVAEVTSTLIDASSMTTEDVITLIEKHNAEIEEVELELEIPGEVDQPSEELAEPKKRGSKKSRSEKE